MTCPRLHNYLNAFCPVSTRTELCKIQSSHFFPHHNTMSAKFKVFFHDPSGTWVSLYLPNFSFDGHKHPKMLGQERPSPKDWSLFEFVSVILSSRQSPPHPALLIHVLVSDGDSQSSKGLYRSEGWGGPSHIPCREKPINLMSAYLLSKKEQLISHSW